MTKQENTSSVAILTTGDEVVNGDIINTNAQYLAQQCFAADIDISQQLSVKDSLPSLIEAISFLLNTNDALLITGGLGPTSDDITRYALAEYLQKPLQEDALTLKTIETLFTKLGHPLSENNRQQALFPEDAVVLPNPNGTAAGCYAVHKNKMIFMLPGPPRECQPMFVNHVLPQLSTLQNKSGVFHRWFIFNISESVLANLVEEPLASYVSKISYRYAYPYIELKVFLNKAGEYGIVESILQKLLENTQAILTKQPASETLRAESLDYKSPYHISDAATGGHLQAALSTPENKDTLIFHSNQHESDLVVEGLDQYWNQSSATEAEISITKNGTTKIYTIPLRGKRVINYAIEFICFQMI